MVEDPSWALAAQAIRQRRIELRLSQVALARKADIALATLRHMEAADQTRYLDVKVASVEEALGWKPGAVDAIRRGEQPTLTIDVQQVPVDGRDSVQGYLVEIGRKVEDVPPEDRDRALRLALALLDEMAKK